MSFPFPARLGLLASSAFLAFAGADARAAPARGVAKVECTHATGPGRVRCELEVRVPPGATITWADAVVARTPPFVTALRARVGPLEASARAGYEGRWAIGLAARARGNGEIDVRIRIVSCVKDACVPAEIEAQGDVSVGE